jgi:hypothetical protein
MALISDSIPNLIQGVSQQPPTLRSPSQLESSENCYPSPVDGLTHRAPTEHIALVAATPLNSAFLHTINRTQTQQYKAVFTDGDVKVFDLTGDEKTVTPVGDALDYLESTDPKTLFRALTVADFTFIVNTEKIPAMTVDLTPVRTAEGLIFAKKGEYNSIYKVFINDVQRATYTTSATDAATLRTTNIATQLHTQLVAAALPNFTFTLSGSVIWAKNSSADFTIRTADSQGGTSLVEFKGKTDKFTNLPTTAPNGFVIAIDADVTSDQGQYYVEAISNQDGEAFGPVTWQESLPGGIPYILDPTTMPHALIRQPNNTFTLEALEWDDRLCGDEDTNFDPSFVGFPINAVYFYKNRLGFLSDENFILSEVGEYFNFFRTTVTIVKDSDPVDSRPTTTQVAILKRALPYNKSMVFFSDLTQFIVPSDAPMTPKTVRCDVISNYAGLMDVTPVDSGKSIYFMFAQDAWTGMSELEVSPNNADKFEAEILSSHVPAYIPAGVFSLAVSTLANVAVALTTGDPAALYLYKTSYSKDKKTQSAWFRWSLANYTDSSVSVLSADFIDATLYLLVQRDGEVFLEKLVLAPHRVDPFHTYVTHLDRRITDAELTVPAAYDLGTNTTLLTLPYDITSTEMEVVTRSVSDNTPYDDPGRQLTVSGDTIGQNTLSVMGDYSANPLWIGQRFNCEFELSKIFVRKQSAGGGQVVDSAGKLQLLKGILVYSNSGPFTVSVTPEGRSSSDYIFTGRVVGDINNVIGQVALRSGQFHFGILGDNKTVRIVVHSNAFFPFQFSSMDWEGTYTKRSAGR